MIRASVNNESDWCLNSREIIHVNNGVTPLVLNISSSIFLQNDYRTVFFFSVSIPEDLGR